MPGGHRELRHRLREEERARGLHEGLRLRVLDRGRHPHAEEGGQVLQKGEEVLLGQHFRRIRQLFRPGSALIWERLREASNESWDNLNSPTLVLIVHHATSARSLGRIY